MCLQLETLGLITCCITFVKHPIIFCSALLQNQFNFSFLHSNIYLLRVSNKKLRDDFFVSCFQILYYKSFVYDDTAKLVLPHLQLFKNNLHAGKYVACIYLYSGAITEQSCKFFLDH